MGDRRSILALPPLVVLLAACAPQRSDTEESPKTPTATSVNLTSPRGLAEHGVTLSEEGEEVARYVCERLIVRDGTTEEAMVGHLRDEGLVAAEADVLIDAPGLDGVVETTFQAAKIMRLTKPSTAERYGELPDQPGIMERSVDLTFEGIAEQDADAKEVSSFEATAYTVLTHNEKKTWQVSALRILHFQSS